MAALQHGRRSRRERVGIDRPGQLAFAGGVLHAAETDGGRPAAGTDHGADGRARVERFRKHDGHAPPAERMLDPHGQLAMGVFRRSGEIPRRTGAGV